MEGDAAQGTSGSKVMPHKVRAEVVLDLEGCFLLLMVRFTTTPRMGYALTDYWELVPVLPPDLLSLIVMVLASGGAPPPHLRGAGGGPHRNGLPHDAASPPEDVRGAELCRCRPPSR